MGYVSPIHIARQPILVAICQGHTMDRSRLDLWCHVSELVEDGYLTVEDGVCIPTRRGQDEAQRIVEARDRAGVVA